MQTEYINITQGQHLKDVLPEIPSNIILNKTITGCGATTLEIVPTSLGDIVTAYASVCVKDELDEISYDKNGKPKKRRIECEIRGI